MDDDDVLDPDAAFNELEASLNAAANPPIVTPAPIPMTPMPDVLPPMTPSASVLEAFITAPLTGAKRQRTASSIGGGEDHAGSRNSSGSFDFSGDAEFDELFATLDRAERKTSDSAASASSAAALEQLVDSAKDEEKPSLSASLELKTQPSSAEISSSPTKPTTTTITTTQGGSSSSSSMPPPPLPFMRPGGIRPYLGGSMLLRPPTKVTASKKISPAVLLSDEVNQYLPGPCSAEERREKITRFVIKRTRRVWTKEIKYSCRKQFAETRPRVAGRFIPKPSDNPYWRPDGPIVFPKPKKLEITLRLRAEPLPEVEENSSDSEMEVVGPSKKPRIAWDRETLILPKRRLGQQPEPDVPKTSSSSSA